MTSALKDRAEGRDSNLILKRVALTPREFQAICSLAREHFGVELGAGKEELVAARMGKLMRRTGYSTFRDFYAHLQADHSGEILVKLIDALTTNHTSFFRERAHFDFLVERVFPEWADRGSRRIWSAASSTGEEPYSIAMTAREYFESTGRSGPSILGSDISTQALETARRATYRSDRLEIATTPWLRKHLLRGEGEWQGWVRMRPEIVEMVKFQRINLVEPLPDVGRFDVIFCRNVMIYFSRQTQEQLVHRLAGCLQQGGYLFVGHSETLTGVQHGLQQVQPAVYRKRDGKR